MHTIFQKQKYIPLARSFAAFVIAIVAALSFSSTAFASAPAAPTNVTATAGDGTATVSFAPDPVNCVALCSYTVNVVGPFSVSPATGVTSPIVVTGLSDGTSYSFTVTASNTAGSSSASSPSNSVTPAAAPASGSTAGTTTGGATNPITINIPLQNPIPNTSTIPAFIASILNAVVLLLTPVVVIMIIYAGFLFVTAVGDTEKLKQAKSTLLYAVIGAAIVLGAKGFALVIQNAINCLAGSTSC